MGSFDTQGALQGRRANIHAFPLVAFRRVRCWESTHYPIYHFLVLCVIAGLCLSGGTSYDRHHSVPFCRNRDTLIRLPSRTPPQLGHRI